MYKIIFTFITLCVIQVHAQTLVRGTVQGRVNEKWEPLPFATVYSADKGVGTIADSSGYFELKSKGSLPIKMVASMVGFSNDTVMASNADVLLRFQLLPGYEMIPVEVVAKTKSLQISTLQTRNTEKITEQELLRAACCNLSESFETNPSVSVNYSDAVTGAKEIQLLGLAGIYTQLLTENLASLGGLAQAYGLGYIPGPWMESIQLSKGAGSVINGYDALAGSVNVEYKKPDEVEEKAYINVFGSSFAETETNFYTVHKLREHLHYMMMVHTEYNGKKIDHNNDGFLDLPLKQQINFYNRWRFNDGKKYEGQFGIKALAEIRDGGQGKYYDETNRDISNAYGLQIRTNRIEAYTKTGLLFPENTAKSFGLQNLFVFHKLNSFFGLKKYDATQYSYHGNFIFMNDIKTCANKIRAGISLRANSIGGVYEQGSKQYELDNRELVPGIFTEYNYIPDENFSVIIGGRADYHNVFRQFFTGRLSAKYNFTSHLILRVAAGNAFRTSNVIADNIGLMVDGKRLLMMERLQPERAWNYGVNVTYEFAIGAREALLNIDAYQTDFINQVVVDPYSDNSFIQVYNLQGASKAKSVSGSINYELINGLDIRVAYKMDDVKVSYYKQLLDKPLISRNKLLVTANYETKNKKWRIDGTMQREGPKFIVNALQGEHHAAQFGKSPAYFIFNGQLTKVFKKFELYAGVENALSYVQHNPIAEAQNPFSTNFDATQVWGPVMGRRIYAGLRMKLM